MKDTIYREDAIGACAYETIECYEARKAIRALPSADRPQGEWIETPEGTICSNCGASPYDDGEYRIANWHSNYCPHCGVPMKGADDE